MLTINEVFKILNMDAERNAIDRIDVCRNDWCKTWNPNEWEKVLDEVGAGATVLKMAFQHSYYDEVNYLWIKVA